MLIVQAGEDSTSWGGLHLLGKFWNTLSCDRPTGDRFLPIQDPKTRRL